MLYLYIKIYLWHGLENGNDMKDIYIDIKNLYKEQDNNKIYNW